MFCTFLKKYSEKKGNRVSIKRSRYITAKNIELSDIVISIRSMVPLETSIMRIAKGINKVCICYWDDDLTHNTNSLFVPKARRSAMIKELKYADAIICPNKYLAHKLAALGNSPKEFVIDTSIDSASFCDKEKIDNGLVKIVYAAGPSHDRDFYNYLEEAICLLQKRYAKMLSLTFVGVHPFLQETYQIPIEYYPCMSLKKYREHMLYSNYDIGLSPLVNCEFSKSKYYNKFIEYSLANVVGVYSKCLPYTLIVKDGENGFLAEDSTESWYNALETAILDKTLRDKCLNNAKKLLKNCFSEESIIDKFSRDIDSLSKLQSKKKVRYLRLLFPVLMYYLFKYCYLPVIYVLNEGFTSTFLRIKNYVVSIKLLNEEGD